MRLLAVLIIIFTDFFPFFEKALYQPALPAPTGYDLIAAVNELRARHGLPPYGVDPLLMLSAQMQADYLASQAPCPVSGHIGPGGTDADARARAVGFPYVQGLDINENWAAMPVSMSFEEIFNTVWADSAHQHTLLHTRGQLAGAGISVVDDTMYLILDVAAYWGDSGLTPHPTTAVMDLAGNLINVSQYVAPVTVATPGADGRLVHRVLSGQSLWSIATAYGVTIESIRQLNFISEDGTIYIGQQLLIKKDSQVTSTPPQQTETPSLSDFLPPKSKQQLTATQPIPTRQPSMPSLFDQNAIFLLLFLLAGIGVILVYIGSRH